MRPTFLFITVSLTLFVVCGCTRIARFEKRDYQTVTVDAGPSSEIARQKNATAVDLLRCDDCLDAEQLLNEALIADVEFGPAHNTLGKVYFQSKKYYLAAWEFEYAARLMPERAEPLNNLGLVYESVGQYDRSISYFEEAVAIDPEQAEYLGNLIRTRLRRGDRPFDVKAEIEQLILIDDRPEWVRWARLELLKDDTEARLLDEMKANTDQDPVPEAEWVPEELLEEGPIIELLPDPRGP